MKNFLMFFFSLPLLTGCVGAGIATFGAVVGTLGSSERVYLFRKGLTFLSVLGGSKKV